MFDVKADEDSMARLLGVAAAQIPETVLVEYRLRLRMFHADGNSGALGTLGIIDMLRYLGHEPPAREEKPMATNWSRIPMDGSVRVMGKTRGDDGQSKWAPGVYVGQARGGKLAIRFDGDEWVRELARYDVRIARGEPMKPAVSKDGKEPETSAAASAWNGLSIDDPVMVQDDGEHKEGCFQGVQEDGQILVLLTGDLTPRPFASEQITCLETRLEGREVRQPSC